MSRRLNFENLWSEFIINCKECHANELLIRRQLIGTIKPAAIGSSVGVLCKELCTAGHFLGEIINGDFNSIFIFKFVSNRSGFE